MRWETEFKVNVRTGGAGNPHRSNTTAGAAVSVKLIPAGFHAQNL